MFVGDKAAPNIAGGSESLGQAKEQEANGANMPAIFQQTGWFQAEDGQWRKEISDKDAKLTGELGEGKGPMRVDKALKHDKLFEASPESRCTTVEVNKEALGSDFGAAYAEGNHIILSDENDLSSFIHEQQHDLQARHGLTMGTTIEKAGSKEAYDASLGEKESTDVEARLNNDNPKKPPKLLNKAG